MDPDQLLGSKIHDHMDPWESFVLRPDDDGEPAPSVMLVTRFDGTDEKCMGLIPGACRSATRWWSFAMRTAAAISSSVGAG
jgi:hypothetical protein